MQLHLHVISCDYQGSHMKNPQHWRSFCSGFFRPIDSVLQELEASGKVAVDFDAIAALKKAPLVCPECGMLQANLPTAKQHHAACYQA